ncbi:MAG: hypothetical protein C5B54_06995 [Acidobacteria bacterium]|nr:MAG: hypothetical protein C5B54_06995 [Acidobacteriota bacterium]
MSYTAHRLEYFNVTMNTTADEAYEVLDNLAKLGANFLAINAVPVGPQSTQLTLFPQDSSMLQAIAKQAGLQLVGPYPAVIVQGEDEPGILATIHRKLHQNHIQAFTSTAVTDGKGRYGCILYLRAEDANRAVKALSD